MYLGTLSSPPAGARTSSMRRIQEVAMLALDGEDLSVNRIAAWDLSSNSFDVLPKPEHREAFATWAGMSDEELTAELERRETCLENLTSTGVTTSPQANAATDSSYAG